ncbi:MAG: hypothetical protein OHK0037_06330 [Elainellaceae cyanobacterium]
MQGAELFATTRSPTCQPATPSPSATISPAPSCPKRVGGFSILAWPPRRHTFKSVPQVVAAVTRSNTSPGPGVGGSCCSRRKSSCPYNTAASIANPSLSVVDYLPFILPINAMCN